jgi:ABC-2 type transport system ATP-binding protein
VHKSGLENTGQESGATMIEVKSLSKLYGSLVAVDNLSFSVNEGDVLGFLGPNGAGKSTTMKMLAGFLTPSSGTASINGHDISSDSIAARRQLGYLPEGAPAYGEMSVMQFLRFVARCRGIGRNDERSAVSKAIDMLNLGSVQHQTVDTLSKGFKRRVGLAQAILHDPKVMILDEPTDGLDPNQKHEVRTLISNMARDKIIIISTHILEEVEAVCNRAMIIGHGRLLADDSPHGLIQKSRYHNAVTLTTDNPKIAASQLSELPEVAAVELLDDELTIFPNGDARLFAAVSRLSEERGWNVIQLRLEAGRMDEVFREITSQEGVS